MPEPSAPAPCITPYPAPGVCRAPQRARRIQMKIPSFSVCSMCVQRPFTILGCVQRCVQRMQRCDGPYLTAPYRTYLTQPYSPQPQLLHSPAPSFSTCHRGSQTQPGTRSKKESPRMEGSREPTIAPTQLITHSEASL